jgi:hypothetical protein
MTFLEQTGLVGPGSLGSPPPAAPNTGGQGTTNGGTNGSLDPNQGDLLPGDSLDGGNQGGNTGGNTTSPSTGTPAGSAPNRTRKPGANAPTDPLDLPQGNPSDNQAGSVATTPTSSILGPNSGNTGMYIIIAMLAIAGLIFLIGLRGFYRRPR